MARARRTGFRVRRARLRDLDLLVMHRRGMWADMRVGDASSLDAADRAYRKWARPRLRNRTLLGWIVEDKNGGLAGSGCVWLRPVQPGPETLDAAQPYLLSMYTEPRFRHKGVASLVVAWAADWCRRRGFSLVRLHASRMGKGLYKQFGFERSWEMRLRLDGQPSRKKRSR